MHKLRGIERITCERDQILNQQVIQSIVTPLREECKVFYKKCDAIGYALYNATAIFNHPKSEILPMLRIAKEALTFDDVLLVPAHSTVLPNTADLLARS